MSKLYLIVSAAPQSHSATCGSTAAAKAQASAQIGQVTAREERAVRYRQALVKKYKHMPEVRKIHGARKTPKLVKKQTALAQVGKESARRKHDNRVKHSKPGSIVAESEREKTIVKQVD